MLQSVETDVPYAHKWRSRPEASQAVALSERDHCGLIPSLAATFAAMSRRNPATGALARRVQNRRRAERQSEIRSTVARRGRLTAASLSTADRRDGAALGDPLVTDPLRDPDVADSHTKWRSLRRLGTVRWAMNVALGETPSCPGLHRARKRSRDCRDHPRKGRARRDRTRKSPNWSRRRVAPCRRLRSGRTSSGCVFK